ncbi:hypothetical protein ACHWQZ_G018038 [Mnemiopsis leidyi]
MLPLQLNETETLLTEKNNNLAETTDRLNNTLHALQTKEREFEECKTRISGYNCFRVTNSTHWDILYTASFYNQVITEELLEILDNSWEKLEHFKGSTLTESFIEFFKKYFHDGLPKCG